MNRSQRSIPRMTERAFETGNDLEANKKGAGY